MAEQRRWVFETGTQRYRDLATGRFLSNTDVIGIVNGIADRTTGDPVTTINTMLADGRLNTADWKTGFARQIKNAYIQQAELAAGGRAGMTPQMWGSVGGSVREQYRYLDKFAKQIEGKQLSPVQIEARTKMYINSSRESFWRIKDMKAKDAGMTEEKWNAIGDDSTCGPCADAGAMGWQPIGTFAQPGSGRVMNRPRTNCQGLTNCRCEKLYRKGPVVGQEEQQSYYIEETGESIDAGMSVGKTETVMRDYTKQTGKEIGVFFDKDGKPLTASIVTGSESSVSANPVGLGTELTHSHTHPRTESGKAFSIPSRNDIALFYADGATIRSRILTFSGDTWEISKKRGFAASVSGFDVKRIVRDSFDDLALDENAPQLFSKEWYKAALDVAGEKLGLEFSLS